MSNFRTRFILISCVVIFITISLLCGVFVLFYLQVNRSNDEEGYVNKISVLSEFDPSENSTYQRLVEIRKDFRTGEYVSYFTPSGKYVSITLLSEYSEEFECEANCVCVDEVSRRVTTGVMRSAYFIVSAASLSLAVHYSNGYFTDFCRKEYSSMCSKIDFADKVCKRRIVTEDSPMVDFEYDEVTGKKKPPVMRSYDCIGKCIPLEMVQEGFDEIKVKNTMALEYYQDNRKRINHDCQKSELKLRIDAWSVAEACFEFEYWFLMQYCQKKGDLGAHGRSEAFFPTACFYDDKSIECTVFVPT